MIPQNWEDRDFYADLGVSTEATYEQIKTAYREHIKQLHPDVNTHVDRHLLFQRVIEAYEVLGNVEKRGLYNQYKGGPQQVFEPAPVFNKPKRKRSSRLISRTILFIALSLFVKNLNFPATAGEAITGGMATTGNGQIDGKPVQTTGVTDPNFNQVLVLMVGPQGAPGIAGIAGKDGFVGLNGYQGRDGVDGAPGAIGRDGAAGAAGAAGVAGAAGAAGIAGNAVALVALDVNDPNCAFGGTKFITSSGVISYACNGGTGTTFGNGVVSVGSCDSTVSLSLQTTYTGGDFMMSGITMSDLSGSCNGKTLRIYLNIKAAGADVVKYGTATSYELGDVISCSTVLTLTPGSATNTVLLNSGSCVNQNTGGNKASFLLTVLSARDVKDGAGALAIQLSD